MKNKADTKRYIYYTRGVCPPEIHFEINEGRIEQLRFVGGGCPGNARVVARLLVGKPLEEVLDYLVGIDCRNGTSCPDQLASAIRALKKGDLRPAESFRICNDPVPRHRIGLIGGIEGNRSALEKIVQSIKKYNVDTVYCCGDLTGNSLENREVLRAVRGQNLLALQGKNDWYYAQGKEKSNMPPLEQKERDWLLRLPQVLSFQMEKRQGVAFFGDYIQLLPDFSDFEPFALEMNMVCGLTGFMQDETVFPALEAMIPQFRADVILFSQIKKWGHWQIAGKDFISVGPALQNNRLSWGILRIKDRNLKLEIIKAEI